MNFKERSPIYIQIIEIIKADIVSGKIKSGEKLPSVREFSESFQVNPNTVQRVFQELEKENIAYSQRGIGTFIVDGADLVNKLKNAQAQKYTKRFINEMSSLGMNKDEINKYLLKILEANNNEYS
ncbi:GntR family transcriptional regulator [Clostridium sp. C8-1-8]|uniref:GntR family transcriptional regulator n=1 Tax=Clostridium sp. C8-1-8 TaxID=2698831 RepID=UPI00325F952F